MVLGGGHGEWSWEVVLGLVLGDGPEVVLGVVLGLVLGGGPEGGPGRLFCTQRVGVVSKSVMVYMLKG